MLWIHFPKLCILWQRAETLLLEDLFLVSTVLLTGSEEVKPFGVLLPWPEPGLLQTVLGRGHERIIHLIPVTGQRQTWVGLENAVFRKVGKLLGRMADHRLACTFKMAWIVKGTFDSELLPGKISAASFTWPLSMMSVSSVEMVIPGSLGIRGLLELLKYPGVNCRCSCISQMPPLPAEERSAAQSLTLHWSVPLEQSKSLRVVLICTWLKQVGYFSLATTCCFCLSTSLHLSKWSWALLPSAVSASSSVLSRQNKLLWPLLPFQWGRNLAAFCITPVCSTPGLISLGSRCEWALFGWDGSSCAVTTV